MAWRTRTARPELLDPPPMSSDRVVQFFVVTLLNQVSETFNTPLAPL
jgi:hypothetical protein